MIYLRSVVVVVLILDVVVCRICSHARLARVHAVLVGWALNSTRVVLEIKQCILEWQQDANKKQA